MNTNQYDLKIRQLLLLFETLCKLCDVYELQKIEKMQFSAGPINPKYSSKIVKRKALLGVYPTKNVPFLAFYTESETPVQGPRSTSSLGIRSGIPKKNVIPYSYQDRNLCLK